MSIVRTPRYRSAVRGTNKPGLLVRVVMAGKNRLNPTSALESVKKPSALASEIVSHENKARLDYSRWQNETAREQDKVSQMRKR